jgi:3-hydroxyacyl-CoA dehydrogenase, NAD binding domain
MGSGIAQIIAQAGIRTTLMDADTASLERGLEAIASRWERLTATGRRSHKDVAGFRANLSQGKIADAKTADLVIEAIVEKTGENCSAIRDCRLEYIFDLNLDVGSCFAKTRSLPRTPFFQSSARAATRGNRAGHRYIGPDNRHLGEVH